MLLHVHAQFLPISCTLICLSLHLELELELESELELEVELEVEVEREGRDFFTGAGMGARVGV
jgi:hypothetical protein